MKCTVLEVHKLSKYFPARRPLRQWLLTPWAGTGRLCALHGVSIRVRSGEILGVIGPNGAGKTTLLRLLADVLEPDAGWVEICGRRLGWGRDYLRREVGFVPSDERNFFWRLTGRQNLEFFATLYGIRRAQSTRRIGDLLDLLDLAGRAGDPFQNLSSGMRKKFAVARALIHEPRVMLLDEVTNSLDPPSAEKVKKLVRQYVLARESRVALWSTHRLEEIAQICDHAITLNRGRVQSFGGAEEVLGCQGRSSDRAGTETDCMPAPPCECRVAVEPGNGRDGIVKCR